MAGRSNARGSRAAGPALEESVGRHRLDLLAEAPDIALAGEDVEVVGLPPAGGAGDIGAAERIVTIGRAFGD